MVDVNISMGVSQKEPFSRFSEIIQLVDKSGINSVWLIDSQQTMKDPYVAMSIAAEQTDTIEFGTGVTNPVTRHETVTANAISGIKELSEDRARLGIGNGDSAVKPIDRDPASLSELADTVRNIRSLLEGRSVTYEGDEFEVKQPDGAVPIYIAASGPKMLELAGDLGDGVIIMSVANKEIMADKLVKIRDGARKQGQDLEDLELDLWVTMSAGDDEQRAINDVKAWCAGHARFLQRRDELPDSLEQHRDEMEKAAEAYNYSEHLSLSSDHGEIISDALAQKLAVAGTPSHCVERLQEFDDLGLDQITISLLSGDREQRIRTIDETIIPELA